MQQTNVSIKPIIKQKPESVWGKFGADIQKAKTHKELMKLSGIDYEITFEDLEVRGNKLPAVYAVSRNDADKVFGIVKDRYEIIQNSDIAETFHDIVNLSGGKYEAAGTMNCGEIAWIIAKLPESVTIGKTKIHFYAMLTNSHNRKSASQISFFAAMDCNTVLMAVKNSVPNKITVPHYSNYRDMISIPAILKMKSDYVDKIGKLFKEMAARKVTEKERDNFYIMIVTDRRQCIEDLATRAVNKISSMTDYFLNHETMKDVTGTALGLYCAVAGYYHTVKWYESDEKRFNNIFYTGDAIKETVEAFHLATMLV